MNASRTLAGVLLVAVPVVFTAAFTGLQMSFDYPDILRFPAGEVLTRFAAGGASLQVLWYGMMISALALIPAALGFAMLYRKDAPLAATLAGGFGALAGLLQALGLLRWVMLVPGLSAAYLAPGATEAQRDMATALFDAANTYLGMGVGEHLGYFFTALFTLAAGAALWREARWLAIAGFAIALGVAAGMAEPFGVPLAGTINALSYTLWAVWALVLGGFLLWPRRGAVPALAAA